MSLENNKFDIVCCAGGMSYGNPEIYINEILRLLKPGGYFIAVDSLNDNPIYKFNRWLNYLKGNRTKSTMINMPTSKLIDTLKTLFKNTKVFYFGSLIWVAPLLKILFGDEKTLNVINYFDKLIKVKKSAFKFVILAKK